MMFRLLVKKDHVAVDGRLYVVHYYEQRTTRGERRYSAEVRLGSHDRVIFDDDSVPHLEVRAARVIPATIYSRMLSTTA
jgi:hypothetical protein